MTQGLDTAEAREGCRPGTLGEAIATDLPAFLPDGFPCTRWFRLQGRFPA
jgi:hypothetical protein